MAREGRLLGQLAAAMKGVPSEGVFDAWMKRQSDLVQATALAYAEREVLEASMRAIERVCQALMLPSYLLPNPAIHTSLTMQEPLEVDGWSPNIPASTCMVIKGLPYI